MKRTYFVCLFLCLAATFLLSQSSPVPVINQAAKMLSSTGSAQAVQQTPITVASGGRKTTRTVAPVDASGGGRAAIQPRPTTKSRGKQVRADDSIQFDPSTLEASFGSVGLYNLVGLGTWNGQPVSPTNMPDDAQRLLAATINFYILPGANNVMYVQVTDVLTTTGAYWFGTAFDDVTQTGVQITFRDPTILSLGVSYSGAYANPGEVLADGTSGQEIDTPLSSTPGFTMDPPLNSTLLIHTSTGAANGFTSLYNIVGTTRIRGGGVFQITFDPTIDLTQLDFSKLQVESEYGLANQFILASNPVPLVTQPLVPASVAPGGAQFTLTVNGTGFVPASVVNWNGSVLPTTFVSYDQLTAVVPASGVTSAGTASVTVTSPNPGGGASNVLFFEITNPAQPLVSNAATFGTDTQPTSIVVADLNSDGKLDLVTANVFDTVSVILSNGDGTFQNPTNYPTGGQNSDCVAVADVNRDGKLDLVVLNADPASSAQISVLLGNGDGTFRSATQFSTGSDSPPQSLVLGDFNRDGNLDVAVTDLSDGTVSILLGNGDGTFQPPVKSPAGPNVDSMVIGDFNHDDMLDLAVTNANDSTVSILLGNGDGTFQPPVTFPAGSGPYHLITADLNVDGNLDLAVDNYGSGVSILLGNGDGTFQPPVAYTVGSPNSTQLWAMASGDLDGNGTVDLEFMNASNDGQTGEVLVLFGNGDGTFQPQAVLYPSVAYGLIIAGDFNSDGRLDLVVASRNGSGGTVLLQILSVGFSPAGLSFGNVNVGGSSTPQNVVLTNTGSAPLSISSIVVTG